jgi:hypothetical protein
LKPEVTESPIPTTVIDRLMPPEAMVPIAAGRVVVVLVAATLLLAG